MNGEDTLSLDAFVAAHIHDDVRKLALRRQLYPDVDMTAALQQIAGLQQARRKLPSWADVKGLRYPSHLNMEQCSSEQTARYKARLACRLLGNSHQGVLHFADLTGGLGVDFVFMTQSLQRKSPLSAIYVEKDKDLYDVACHNFRQLGVLPDTCIQGDGVACLQTMEKADLIYLDPARRDKHGSRTFALADCTPDVTELVPLLRSKSRYVLIKVSPMLDWRKAVYDMQGATEVHIVGVGNECKELLLVVHTATDTMHPRVYCAGDSWQLEFEGDIQDSIPVPATLDDCRYLYEPHATVMKAGCFVELAMRYGVAGIASNSHLFVSDRPVKDFPGRSFQVIAQSSMNKKELRQQLDGLTHANITVRNFPLTADQLRKRLRLRDGGDTYIFATTTERNDHLLMICRPLH